MYRYHCNLIRVIDGDTIVVEIDLGLRVWTRQTIRLAGIDAPEPRGESKEKGKEASAHLSALINNCRQLVIHTEKSGKYGRWLGVLFRDNESMAVNHLMVQDGHAVFS